jgi:hypothetical protein
MQQDALRSVCRELPWPLLVACEVPVYRLRMNRCGSHAKRGYLGHNFNRNELQNPTTVALSRRL